MRVLIACEFSAVVRNAFQSLGHEAWSCDLLPTDGYARWHIQGDVLPLLENGWDMMIAHPPCTYLANSANKHLYIEPDRERKAQEAAQFFRALMNSPIERICIENPIMRHAVERVGRKQDQVIQPWQHGHVGNQAPLVCGPQVVTEVAADEHCRRPHAASASRLART